MSQPAITSLANPGVKAVVALRRRRGRERAGRTLVEGLAELELAYGAGAPIETVYVCEDLMPDPEAGRRFVEVARGGGIEVVPVSAAVFAKMAYREGPDGLLGVSRLPACRLEDLTLGPNPLVVLCEAIEKPGNLGAILRTADAAGVDAVIVADAVTDLGNPNVVRASKGSVFAVPVAAAPREDVLAWLAARSVAIVAATPDAPLSYTRADLDGPIALAVGAEHEGLTGALLSAAAVRVSIPMAGRVDSLNAATSAAILMYEAVRQRSE